MSASQSRSAAPVETRVSRWPALLEVLALPVMGMVAAMLIGAALGIRFSNPFADLRPDALPYSWLPLAAEVLKMLLLQYAGYLLVAAALLWPRRELTARRLGLGANGIPWARLFSMGLLLACLLVPVQMLIIGADARWDLGDTAPWRRALIDAPRTADYWLLMAVASFGLVPVLEELFYRGVLQGRLQQVMPPAHAMVLISVLFTLGHAQYHEPNVINLVTVLFVFGSSLVFGWLYWKTGSIWPGVVLHAATNVPWPAGSAAMLLIAALLAIAALTRHRWRPWSGELAGMLRARALGFALLPPVLATAIFSVSTALAGALVVPLAAIMLVGALLWGRRLRQHTRPEEEAGSRGDGGD